MYLLTNLGQGGGDQMMWERRQDVGGRQEGTGDPSPLGPAAPPPAPLPISPVHDLEDETQNWTLGCHHRREHKHPSPLWALAPDPMKRLGVYCRWRQEVVVVRYFKINESSISTIV